MTRPLDFTSPIRNIILLLSSAAILTLPAEETVFRDDFKGKLAEGWSWRREHRETWRVNEQGLEVRIEPGNMWGPANDAQNVMLHPVPDATRNEIEISVTFQNEPTGQYEQTDLVWYYDDGHMVKLGRELVDGKLSIVMGREEADKTHTIVIIPIDMKATRLRLLAHGKRIRGQFRAPDATEWRDVGECDLPAVENVPARASLQFYQGQPGVEHWARVSEFRIVRTGD